jgi:PAS domain S-box-containing protein
MARRGADDELMRQIEHEPQLSQNDSAEAHARYFELFNLGPVAHLTVDRSGVILEANRAATTLLDEERESLLGLRQLAAFVVPNQREAYHDFHNGLFADGGAQGQLLCELGGSAGIRVRIQGILTAGPDDEQGYAIVTIVDLSEVVRAESKLARQEEELRRTGDRLASFMRVTNDCVLMLSSDGVITEVNPPTLALLGMGEEQVLGRHISSLDHGTPEIRPELSSTEVTWRDQAGDPHIVLLAISPIRSGERTTEFLCTARDISERRAAEKKLEGSERLLRQMAETIEDGFYIREYPSERLSYVSPAYEQIFGCSRQQFFEDPDLSMQLVHPDDVEGLSVAYECFVKGDPCDEQFRIVRPDGAIRWVRERAFLVEEEDGKVERIVGIAQDITEQRQFELEVRQGQKMEAIGQLASGVAHDFNNILMGIHGCASIGLSKLGDHSEVRPFLEAIRTSSESGTAIVKQLLAFSSKRELEVRSFDLNSLLSTDETMLTRLLGDDVVLSIRVSKRPCRVRMDMARFEQILMNLAINSRNAMPDGGKLLIETRSPAQLDSGQRLVSLRVVDNGVGMSEEVRQRIFEPFYTTRGIGEGTGLGLSTVYGIVQEAGGSIRCESEPGKGTAFEVFLPYAEADGDDSSIRVRAETPDPTPQGGTILVVEDEATVRLATRLYLESAGYQVFEASTSAQAVEILTIESPIDLLLTDVGLPGFSGAGLAARARELDPSLPVVFMSAHPAGWLIDQGRLGRGEETLQKPFTKADLVGKVTEMLEASRSARSES